MANDAQQVPEANLFAAGDVRANENIELTAMQTLFVRNHNHRTIATTTTDSNGNYCFTDQTGIPGTGKFTVRLVLPSTLHQTSANPGTISLSRGGLDVDGENFGVDFNFNNAAGLAWLLDSSGKIVASTTTDSAGHYTFAGQGGSLPATDTVVTLVLHPGNTANPATLTITKGTSTKTVQFGADFLVSDLTLAALSNSEQGSIMQALDTNKT
jgi:hypothetical protein